MGFVQLFLYGNLFMALCAGLWTASAYAHLGLLPSEPSWALLGLVSGGTLLLYNIARYPLSKPGDNTTQDNLEIWFNTNQLTVAGLLILGAVGVLQGLIILPINNLWPLAPAGILVLLYYAPLFSQRAFGLRTFGTIKNLIIGLVWAMVTLWVPFTVEQSAVTWNQNLLGLMAERTLFIYILMLPFDLVDVDRDASEGVITIPRRYGVRFTKHLIIILLILLALLQIGIYPGFLMVAHLLSTTYVGTLLIFFRSDRSDMHFLGFWDGAIAAQAALTLLISL